ncbi:MAG: hypothetical protein ABIO04_07085 [Ferruginibacter sp.]
MNTNELIKKIFLRIGRFKYLILISGILLGILGYLYAKNIKAIYTGRCSLFPLTASSDNSASTNALSSILGLSESPKSFSQEASINIVELALSRNTREAVAAERLPEFGNKPIAQILIDNFNKNKSYFETAISMPKTEPALLALGGDLLKGGIAAKINKNGILEINYSNTNKELVSPISYTFIDKISAFYKDLKIQKARLDYNFTIQKIDSLDRVLKTFDRRAIQLSNTTLFVPAERIEYSIPKENLSDQKEWVTRQRDASASNREEALWRLQKVTPIIATLDRPDPPFEVKKSSSVLYGGIGFFLGCLLAIFLSVAGILYGFLKLEINKAIFGTPPSVETNSTAAL